MLHKGCHGLFRPCEGPFPGWNGGRIQRNLRFRGMGSQREQRSFWHTTFIESLVCYTFVLMTMAGSCRGCCAFASFGLLPWKAAVSLIYGRMNGKRPDDRTFMILIRAYRQRTEVYKNRNDIFSIPGNKPSDITQCFPFQVFCPSGIQVEMWRCLLPVMDRVVIEPVTVS